MITETTDGIRVSVQTHFQVEYSHPENHHYVYSYQITIENTSNFTTQLLRRRWYIFDATGVIREVEGEGVIGHQPVLEPGEQHNYTSGCNLRSPIGKMKGIYIMQRVVDGKTFEVTIPEFTLEVPSRFN
jgi:ApaG protein